MVRKKRQCDPHENDDSSSTGSCEEKNTNPADVCVHINKSIDINRVRKAIKLDQLETEKCSECIKTATTAETTDGDFEYDKTIWLCLKCGSQLCGRAKNKHALSHYDTPRSDQHFLAINTTTMDIWCYRCDKEIPRKSSKKLLECYEFICKEALKPAINNVTTIYNETIIQTPSASTEQIQENKGIDLSSLPRVRGLSNLGNTCFFNAVLQCLAQTPFLLDVLKETAVAGEDFQLPGGPFKGINGQIELPQIKGTLPGWGTLTSALAETLEELQKGGGVYSPRKLLSQLTIKWPQFSGGDQHDSHELLRHLLESVKSEDLRRYQKVVLTSLGYKTNTVPASVEDEIKQKIKFYGGQAQDRILRPEQVFRGFLVSTLACQDCQNTSSRHENFLDISLPVSVGKPQPPRRKTSPEPATISKHQIKKDKEKERKMKKQQKHANKKNVLVLSADGDDKTTTENIDSNIVNEENGLSSESDCSKESDADVEDNLLDDLPKTISAENRYPDGCNVKSQINPEKSDDTPENPNKDQETVKIPVIQINDSENGEVSTSDFVREENEKNALNNVVVELAISAHGCANLVKEFSDFNIEDEENKEKVNRRRRTYSHADWSTTIAPRYQCEEGECSVQSCLSNFTASELMTDNNKVGCDKCTERINGKDGKTINTNATKQFLISNPPAVLILHLKRFQVGPRCMFRKLARHVSFPMTLDIASFCGSKVKNLPNIQRHQKKLMYSLYGVVEHSGGVSILPYFLLTK